MKNQFINHKKQLFGKWLLMAYTICTYHILSITAANAQNGNGEAGIQKAADEVAGYFDTGCTLMYAIGAVMGIIGAVKVFNKWNAGEPDTSKVASSWFGSCIFLVIVATVLKSFFGV
ncbi:DUF4134 domain-containing protein [Pedobacter cryoconitis]|uniref:Uncharacterized protein DUF4134 n=1 Tax=Pedobacter cryoconitis TaxID=188932 RepID=A0A327SJK2_9SPHI|nr:uncharacterized protein DUF4134 [Pedobacter cryoconitis]